ncbi:carbon storage regulator [Novipirellula artificiosorum]|uniref:Translational regulator CsrA n=1 Tax=Novipirellula artificiosorum TaxID=2528016 RepID=A0A5C6E297_9BACT|nr:carbon storage regulator [Novipirellula artificiosorum]TWU42845.1 Carbon storage regulator [Novipirellula artificiosorum]
MLVLSRKEGEQLLIGENIVLTINRISANRVAIGIEAPKDIRIVRGELDQKEISPRGVSPMSVVVEQSTVSVASQADR